MIERVGQARPPEVRDPQVAEQRRAEKEQQADGTRESRPPERRGKVVETEA